MMLSHSFRIPARRVAPWALAAAVLFLSLPSGASAQARGGQQVPLTVSGEFRLWLPNFDGSMRSGTDVDPGIPVRLDTHLDLEEHPEVYEFGVGLGDVRWGRIAGSFLRFSAPGNKVLTYSFRFADVDFFLPETVHSEFSIEIDKVTVSYIQHVGGSYLLSYELGMAYLRWDASIENRHTGKKASEDASASLPVTGIHAIVPLGETVRLMLGFSGVFFRTSDDDVSQVDTYIDFTFTLAKYVQFGLGFRHLKVEADFDLKGGRTGELEFTLRGIYFTVGIKI